MFESTETKAQLRLLTDSGTNAPKNKADFELLYHVRTDDSVIGRIERDRAHKEEVLHRSGIVFLVRSNGMVLLQLRSPLKRIFPDRHDASCAFHVTFGESYADAAQRELREEVGISAPVTFVGKFLHYDPPEHQIVSVFICRSDERVTINPGEAVSADFHPKAQVDRIIASHRVTPWLRDGWKLAMDKI